MTIIFDTVRQGRKGQITMHGVEPAIEQTDQVPLVPRGSGGRSGLIALGILAAIIVVCATLSAVVNRLLTHPVTLYSAPKPGPTCGAPNGGLWQIAGASPQITCAAAATTLERGVQTNGFAELLYTGQPQTPFPAAYRIEVDITFTGNTLNDAAGIIVHQGLDGSGEALILRQNGLWSFIQLGPNDQPATLVRLGITRRLARQIHMIVEVHGTRVNASVGGLPLFQVADPAFSATQRVGLLVGNDESMASVGVNFANFVFAPLADTPLSVADAQSTVTAEPADTARYSVVVPGIGQGCEPTAGLWAMPQSFNDTATQVTCGIDGLDVQHSPSKQPYSTVRYYGSIGRFPPDYAVAVDVTTRRFNGGCAGLSLRNDPARGGYTFLICDGLTWSLAYVDPAQHSTVIGQGTYTIDDINNYNRSRIIATVTQQTLTFTIDGNPITKITDDRLKSTAYIGLVTLARNGLEVAAKFINFAYDPTGKTTDL